MEDNFILLSPQRAERLWLALAVATLWIVILGGGIENHACASLQKLSSQQIVIKKTF